MPSRVDVAPEGDLFYSALQHAEVWLQNAHRAVLGTMEAELKHMRYENMRLRGILEEAGLGEKANLVATTAIGPMEEKEEEKPKSSTTDTMTSCEEIKVQAAKEAQEASPVYTERQQASATAFTTASSNAHWIPVKHEGLRSSSLTTVSTATPTTTATPTSPDGFVLRSKEDLSAVSGPPERSARIVFWGKTLEALLAQWGWQHLEAEILSESGDVALASLGGAKLKLRMEHSNEPRQPGRLLAWDEDGNMWQALDVLIRKRRLQKVVRACPVAATREFTRDESESEAIQVANVEVIHAGRQQLRTPLTLAQLEALPIEAPVKPLRHRGR
eukprot:s22_g9.t1